MVAVEKYERLISKKLGSVEVLYKVNYSINPKKIGRSKLSVPEESFGRMYWNDQKEFKKCFLIPNDDVSYKLRELEINCEQLLK